MIHAASKQPDAKTSQSEPLVSLDARLRLGAFALDFQQEWAQPATAIFGPSGVGKSVLIELLAGFRRVESGHVRFCGRTLDDGGKTFVPPRQRRFGWVPQDLALWPHMNVRRNIEYGAKGENAKLLGRAVELLEIGELLERRPAELSGGQQQRVALARAVAAAPRLLLLDEPLASLDASLRGRIVPYIRRLQSELGIPYIYVSHDRHELYALADHVLIVRDGRCVAAGSPEHVFGHAGLPQYLERDRFANRYDATVERRDDEAGTVIARLNDSLTFSMPVAHAPPLGEVARIGLDPADIILSQDAPAMVSAQNIIRAQIDELDDSRGPVTVHLRHASGVRFKVFVTPAAVSGMGLEPGMTVHLLFKAHAIHVL